ncbi:MAG: hypothetical protein UV74_C0013G0244 [Candidatus Woesebacteria bacterium GW2011_GWB1_43_14]|uniref:Uncharacterized protein n=1 Tax=Candidatus Woesebacteria bacterium GW2011_GWB1_43_14 TaxID=1618578 RepID=A0A0G1DHT8_9BACT|nr:MAG: hypothetical protein UT21_C0002G0049 [Candidatus Woesebacteria bacterium GW2011_GWA1_39_11b]KKS78462.1 MAG: hypothetical protein UV51_C0001G0178 [Candidatus Woesebacteria bacterium GW2011_GWC1_42_9]KKS97122.1 MAG: hypothetical protein UV74_C0013G0244 [Candidatus Woesebacteria bacterium GW2011_GWB1_43_14]
MLNKKRFKKNWKKFRKQVQTYKAFLIISFLIFVLAHFFLPLENLNAIADNFNKISIGLAAIIGAYFGSSYFRDELARKRSIKYYREKYPINEYGNKFRIIESENAPGAIYLHDLVTLHKHHIWNMKTVYDLGWQVFKRERLPEDEFHSILIGDPIRTTGELGE